MRGRPRKNNVPTEHYDTVLHLYCVLDRSLQYIANTYEVTPYIVRGILEDREIRIKKRGRQFGFKPKKRSTVEIDALIEGEANES